MFKVPASVEFYNTQDKDIDQRLEMYEDMANEASLDYPIFIKIQSG